MDLKGYYQKIRALERTFEAVFAVIVSMETADGGKAGVRTEVPAQIAARMIVEGIARIATEQEAKEFHEQKTDAKRVVDQSDASRRMQVTVVSESDLRTAKRKQ